MSRIGKAPIKLPSGVNVSIDGRLIEVKGPKGELKREIHPTMALKQEDDELIVDPQTDVNSDRKFHGLTRSLVANMVEGVSEGFSKKLILKGVGYRAQVSGSDLNLTLGFSHPVTFKAPDGISLSVDKQTEITVSGASKEKVGQAAADIRAFRKPEPYHGKGVRYEDERIITKVGKSGSK